MLNVGAPNSITDFPAVTVRIEPNYNGSAVLFSVRCDDGTQTKGFARTRLEAMQKAVAFIEATVKASAASARPELVVNNEN